MTPGAVLALALAMAGTAAPAAVRLAVPVVRQAPERCGPAALAMVMRFQGADSAALAEAERAYDPVLRGALITDLAAAARRAGFTAVVAEVSEDSLVALLERGVAPILLYRRGAGPLTVGHYGVLVGWDPGRRHYALNDGGAATRTIARADLMRRWHAAGSLALLLGPAVP
ncbi:MAG: cysteine peptidase family C39 domain-containing protein [Candidatus Eisenbacteria bacterium]